MVDRLVGVGRRNDNARPSRISSIEVVRLDRQALEVEMLNHNFAADRMEGVQFQGIRKIAETAAQLERQGKHVIHFELGRPDFDTPAHIKQSAKDALDKGMVHYTSSYGLPDLCSAISEKLHRENGLDYSEDGEIIVTVGANEALASIFTAFINPGDEVIIPDPSWPNYVACVLLAGGIPRLLKLDHKSDYVPDLRELGDLITPRTKMVVVPTPHNPTGSVWTRDSLIAIGELAVAHDLLVLADEIYERFIFDGSKHFSLASVPEFHDHVITVNGFSKTYSMTGWRVGFLAADKALADVIIRTHQYNVTCATTFAQVGAVTALRSPQDQVTEMIDEFARRRDLTVKRLAKLPGVKCGTPRGAFYAFPDMSGLGMSDLVLSDYLLNELQVATVPGSVFGPSGEGHIRIAYCCSYSDLEEGLDRIEEGISRIR